MELLEYWGLDEHPFRDSRESRYFHPGYEHAEALVRLRYLTRNGALGIGLLTGEIGAGKTTVLRRLLEECAPERRVAVHLPNGARDETELERLVLDGLSARSSRSGAVGSRYARHAEFRRRVGRSGRFGRGLLLVVDEAQELDADALVAVKGLMNIAETAGSEMAVVLAGQPELGARVRELPQIDQRVGLRYHLGCMAETETGPYVEHRLRAAGWTGGTVFDAGARRELYAASAGIPREMNRICALAMESAMADGRRRVEADDVVRVGRDLLAQRALA